MGNCQQQQVVATAGRGQMGGADACYASDIWRPPSPVCPTGATKYGLGGRSTLPGDDQQDEGTANGLVYPRVS